MLRPTIRQLVSLGVGHPSGPHDQIFFSYCQTVLGLLEWGALSDERKGLYFTTTAGPCQRSQQLQNMEFSESSRQISSVTALATDTVTVKLLLNCQLQYSTLSYHLHGVQVIVTVICCLLFIIP
jgi:hypothetical protein